MESNVNNNPVDSPEANPDTKMAVTSATSAINPSSDLSSTTTVTSKRSRPTPSKTFQCRNYGDCRMVFSRSEHLARHIRKHTGERPFTCHCGKNFSRLDNLRQHAQTVHADKADQNERMMRELGRVHATMAAANKQAAQAAGVPARSSRGSQDSTSNSARPGRSRARPGTSTGYEGAGGADAIYPGLAMPANQLNLTGYPDLPDPYLVRKKEQREDGSIDSENGNTGSYSRTENTSNGPYSHHEHSNVRRQDPRQHSHHDDMDIDADNTTRRMRQPFQQHDSEIPNGYSFRSFRGPQQYRSSNSSYSSQPQYSQSSPGGGSGMFRFNVPDNGFSYSREREHNPSYSRSRPPTDTTARPGTSTRPATATTLPPLASIVPSSIAPLPPPPTSHARPGSNAGFSGRPLSNAGFGGILGGYGSSFPSFGHTGAPLPTLSGSKSANGLRLPPPTPSNFDLRPGSRGGSSQGTFAYRPGTAPALGPGTTSNHNGYAGYGMVFGWEDERSSGESPFSFNAPPLSSSGSRKRGFSAVDEGDGDDRASESRPQSRRLSVMELCAPEDIPGRPESSSGSGILFTPIRDREYPSTTSGSRPGTSGTGLIVRGAAGLALGDRENGTGSSTSKNHELFLRAAPAAGGPTSKSKRESPGGTAIYYPNNASSKPASPRPSATIPSPFPANAARPSSSGSHRSCSPSRSPVESDRHGHGHGHVSGYGQHGRQRSGSGYRQYGVIGGGHGAGYGSPLSNPGRHTSEHGLAARSPGSDASVSPATSTRSPLSAGSASPPSAVSTASVHAWR